MGRFAASGQNAMFVVLAAACSEEGMPRADVAEVCGKDGPVRILDLDDAEVLVSASTQHVDDRLVYGIRRFEIPVSDVTRATTLIPVARGYAELDARVESIDRCGEDRRVLGEGFDRLLSRPHDDAPWLGYRSETEELFWIDIEGVRPSLLLDLRSFMTRGTGLLAFRADHRDLLTIDRVGDELAIETLATGIIDAFPRSNGDLVDGVPPSQMLLLREGGELVVFDLQSRRTTSVARELVGFLADPSLRWIVGWPAEAEIFLLDRETGERSSLAFDSDSEVFPSVLHGVVVSSRIVDNGVTHTRITALPDSVSIVLEGRWLAWRPTSDSRVVVKSVEVIGNGVWVLEIVEDELEVVGGPFTASSWDETSMWTKACDEAPTPDVDVPCDVVAVSIDTLQSEIRQHRVWSNDELPGDRWLQWMPYPGTTSSRGDLWVLDGATGERRLLADYVATTIYEGPDTEGLMPRQLDEVVYQVRDRLRGRTGLWRARFEE